MYRLYENRQKPKVAENYPAEISSFLKENLPVNFFSGLQWLMEPFSLLLQLRGAASGAAGCGDKASLISEFKRLQSVRKHTYEHFNSNLIDLVQKSEIEKYADICSHFTKIFADISAAVKQLRARLNVDHKVAAKYIDGVQELERQKLSENAKYHVAYIQLHCPGIHFKDASEIVHPSELEKTIQSLETLISEQMEALQGELVDEN